MRIGIFTDTYFPQTSGVSTSIETLCEELREHGHEVYLFTTTDPGAKPAKHIFRYRSVPFVFFKERRVATPLLHRVYRQVKQLHLDLIHTQTEFGLGLCGQQVARMLHIPLVHTYHTWYEHYLHYIFNGRLIHRKTVQVLSKWFCNRTNEIVVPSAMMGDVLADYGVSRPINAISTGVQIPPRISDDLRCSMRQSLGLPDDAIVLLSVNRLAEEKNLDALLEHFKACYDQDHRLRLVLVGDGPEREKLEHLIRKLYIQEQVIMTGMVAHDEVSHFYQMADVYVNLSVTETQGLTFSEAIVNRLPIVALANDYLSSLNKQQQIGILLEDPDDLYQAIQEVMVSREAIVNHLDLLTPYVSSDHFYQQMITVYERLVNSDN
ncbi:MAG: glycosyltransferase [Planctomycetia bacterium]|nr:glycosyltransferase [Planctomycetia bacterium]